ncbi:MAG: transcriptional regulator [Ignavibacteria bacterium GWB2_35_12]|nr:MAG: transcriptional regulator [Ignavibacteria bacterium GWB2_35_12]OGU89752.1 MAG: transcriptional regulator [Ignavibacteria bacterium RIFOXYA2_FULL_35_10]OGV24009.1 MAG: transcriptional regulator [Ignavibacteria bacterium RIFOXYC2_FULL_35_21]
MNDGDIVTAYFPQSDRTFKKRPALLLKKLQKYDDYLVCGISSNIHQYVEGFDEIILKNHAEFDSTGLKNDSVIRLGYLTVIPNEGINGAIGKISNELHRLLLKRLSNYLISN